MPTAERSPRLPLVLAILMAPAIWLERARGRKRFLLLLIYLVIGTGVLGVLYWEAQLRGLPDIGDPFDPAMAAREVVPDEENAFDLYREAVAALQPGGELAPVSPQELAGPIDWETADHEWRGWLGENQEALELWRRGAERSDAMPTIADPGSGDPMPDYDTINRLGELSALGRLEASRMTSEGDPARARSWLRAALRSSRHLAIRGGWYQSSIGGRHLSAASTAFGQWAGDPRTPTSELRPALDDIRGTLAITPSFSDQLRYLYGDMMRELDDPRMVTRAFGDISPEVYWYLHPRWVQETYLLATRDRERSRRVIRLTIANWLAFVDVPHADRPEFVGSDNLGFYRAGPEAPLDARRLSPEELRRWYESCRKAPSILPDALYSSGQADTDRLLLESLLIQVAEEIYLREHGKAAADLDALVDADLLESIPESFRDDLDWGLDESEEEAQAAP